MNKLSNFYTNVIVSGDKIKARSIIGSEPSDKLMEEFSPSLYVPTELETKFKTINNESLEKIDFKTIENAKDYMSHNPSCHGVSNFAYSWISDNYPTDIDYQFDLLTIFNIDIEVDVDVGFPDPIEALTPVNLIVLKHNNNIYGWGTGAYKNHIPNIKYTQCTNEEDLLGRFIEFFEAQYPDIITGYNVKFFDLPYLVNRINKVFHRKTTANALSPWNKVSLRSEFKLGKEIQYYDFQGISILDYIDLYKLYSLDKRESYRLDFIGFCELGMNKLTFDEVEHGYMMYKVDFQKHVEYCIRDVEIVDELDKKLNFLKLAVTVAYEAKVNFQDVFSPIRLWESLIGNHLKSKNVFSITKKQESVKTHSIVGGFVKTPKLGFSEWVTSFDLESLYPNIIRSLNIGPETIVEGDVSSLLPETTSILKPNMVDDILSEKIFNQKTGLELNNFSLTLAANGQLYSHEKQSFMSELVEKMFNKRKAEKAEMIRLKSVNQLESTAQEEIEFNKNLISTLDAKQHSRKILLNSLYGACGNQYFLYFDERLAESITMTGQTIIRFAEKYLNIYLNDCLKNHCSAEGDKDYVIAVDTDSVYLDMSDFVNAIIAEDKPKSLKVGFLDRLSKERIQPQLEWIFQKFANHINIGVGNNYLKMKREVIADKGFWTAKKKYALNVYDNEGVRYKEPEIKIMGIESVRSSTPAPCRKKLEEVMKIILTQDAKTLREFIADFKKEFLSLSPDDISFPRGVNGLLKYGDKKTIYSKGTPMQVRGSLLYNHHIKKMKLENKYKLIGEGDKIKFVYLKVPNTFRENIIAFPSYLPEEFALGKHIDYDLQFQKSFLDPIEKISDHIKWELVKRARLMF